MYEEHFGLSQAPFSIAPDPSFLYLSSAHREALAHLMYGFSHGGFVLVTGEVGTGKTTLLRNLLKQTPPELDVAFILNPRLTVRELLGTLCDELGIPYDVGSTTTVKQYIDLLTRHLLETHRSGRSTVMIIDEAQNLSPAVLEQVRLLTNLETDERKLLRIILIGQPELAELLDRQDLRQLAQRITARYHLGSLNRPDSYAYIMHRISRAGGDPNTFSQSALRRLYALSKGTPRIINVIADRALLGAYTESKHQVTGRIVNRAAREALGKAPDRRGWWYGAAAAVAVAAGIWAILAPPIPGGGSETTLTTGILPESEALERSQAAPEPGLPERPASVDGPSTWKGSEPRTDNPIRTTSPPADEAPEQIELSTTQTDPRSLQPSSAEAADAEAPVTAVAVDSVITPDTYAEMLAESAQQPPPAPSAKSGSVSASRVSEVSRPSGNTFSNRRLAYAAVFERWGVDFSRADSQQIPCDFAPSAGLQCLTEKGDWSEIRRLNLPVILELWDGQADPYHAALLGMNDGSLILRVAERQLETTQRALRDQWSGNYVVLWQTPPGYYGSLRAGQTHATVGWLRRQLAALVERSLATPRPNLFDDNLHEAVLQFQAQEGLLTDGIVGPATWIKLADRLQLPQPRLAG